MVDKIFVNEKYKSVNFGERDPNIIIDTIVIHFTQGDFKRSLELLTEEKYGVSSHYLVDRDGSIYNLVSPSEKAWHAGKSFWNGKEAVNENSIGIEIVNLGNEEFTALQINSVIGLCKFLKELYPTIHDHNIIGHSDVALGRKIDPGKYFPWEILAKNDIGIWHNINTEDLNRNIIFKIGEKNPQILDIKDRLGHYGYGINDINDEFNQELKIVIYAMQLHFDRNHATGDLDNVALKIIDFLGEFESV